MTNKELLKEIEMLEYRTFKRWFNNYPNLKNPQIAITSSLARWIAQLVYDKLVDQTQTKEVEK